MKIKLPPVRHPTLMELHERKCFLLGITDPAKMERLWKEEVERRRKIAEQDQPAKKRRRKRGE